MTLDINANTTFLIVSDDNECAQQLKQIIKIQGFKNSHIVESGIDILRGDFKSSFDFILCGTTTKLIGGWLFIQEYRNSPEQSNTPIIMFGRDVIPVDPEQLQTYGILNYLQAPFNAKGLMESLTNTLEVYASAPSLEAKYTKAKESLIAKDTEEAISRYSELVKESGSTTRSLIGLTYSHIAANNTEEVEKCGLELSKENPDTPSGIMMSARIQMRLRNYKKAESLANHLLEVTRDVPLYFYNLVQLASEHNLYEWAAKIANKALGLGHQSREFYLVVARVQCEKSELEACLSTLNSNNEKFGENVSSLNLRGVCLHRLQRHQEAKTQLLRAQKLAPTDAKILFNLALVNIDLGDTTKAKKDLELCIKIQPSYTKAINKLKEIA